MKLYYIGVAQLNASSAAVVGSYSKSGAALGESHFVRGQRTRRHAKARERSHDRVESRSSPPNKSKKKATQKRTFLHFFHS